MDVAIRRKEYIILGTFLLALLLMNSNDILGVILTVVIMGYSICVDKCKLAIYNGSGKFFLFIFAFVCLQYIVLALASSVEESTLIKCAFNGIYTIVLMMFCYSFGRKIKNGEGGCIIIIAITTIHAIVNIYDWYTQTGGEFGRYNFVSSITGNVTGNVYAIVVVFFLALTMIDNRVIRSIACAAMFLNVIVVMGRAYLLLLIGLLIVYIGIKKGNDWLKTIARILAVLLMITIIAYLLMKITIVRQTLKPYIELMQDAFNNESGSVITRQETHQSAIELFKQHPILGVGYGLFGIFNTRRTMGIILASAHGGIYDILAEFGIIGICGYIYLFIHLVIVAYSLLISNRGIRINMIAIIIISFIVFIPFLHNSFLPPAGQRIYYYHSAIVWYLIGVIEQEYYTLKEY